MPPTSDRPKKLQRISQACDLCHRRSIRCRPSAEEPQNKCQNCHDFGVDCTYNRPSRRRRNPSEPQTSPANLQPGTQQYPQRYHDKPQHNQSISPQTAPRDASSAHPELSHYSVTSQGALDLTGAYTLVRDDRSHDVFTVAWRSFALASASAIEEYLHIYMEVIYPVYPLFHGPTLWDRVRKQHHIMDRSFFASTMAACALAAARARDGALGHRINYKESPEKSSEIFFAAAQDAVLQDLSHAEGIGFLKACAMLTLASIQYGQIGSTQKYLGQFWALAGMQNFHDEDQWPKDISIVEVEERRRLFWSMYNLDIYSTVVFGSMMRVQETHANVSYPSEANDEDLTANTAPHVDGHHWLRGQNFITDLYRILEHIVQRVHRLKPGRNDRISVTRLLISDGVGDTQVMDSVLGLYYGLHPRFKDFGRDITGDKKNDYYGFMAANIQFTLQLVRMALFSSSVTPDINEKCAVVEQVLQTFHTISPQYLRAISTPLVYHLGTIGQILASVMNGLLSEASYARVRALLVSLADLLQGLEYGLQPTAGASDGLRKQIEKIDAFMDAQRRMLSTVGLPQHEGMLLNRTGATFPLRSTDATSASGEEFDSNHRRIYATQESSSSSSNISSLDEFYLPPDLVNQAAWPWPFDLCLGPGNDGMAFPGMQGAGLGQQ